MTVTCLERCDGVPTHVLIVSTITPQTLPNVFFISDGESTECKEDELKASLENVGRVG